MDLHKKFQNSPAVDFSILSDNKNSESLLNELMKTYDEQLLKGTIDTNNLKTYHMLLCNEYQKRLEKLLKNNLSISDLFLQLDEFSQEQLLLINDIIILKLFFSPANICQEFHQFRSNNSIEARNKYMKIIECFVDAFRLLQFSNPNFAKPANFAPSISKDLQIWYVNKEESDWKSLISLLPKFIEISGLESLKPLWLLLQENVDLTGFCIFINFCLEEKLKEEENLLSYLTDEILWKILSTKLKSRLELERKQALYVFKILTGFFQSQRLAPELKEQFPKIPFTCEKNPDSIKVARNNYILILESLEEKKQHLVLPSFSVLNDLLSANLEHRKCGNCFDFSWLSCILQKILHHESNAVIKHGLSFILNLNPDLFPDYFIESLARALNNRFLYETEDNENPPKIVEELCNFFTEAENSKVDLISKFLSAIPEIFWDPISIFYVTFALCAIKTVSFPWGGDQLMNLKKLVEKNLTLHSPLLRKESQTNVIIAMTHFTREIDLEILANFLTAFPKEDENLSRGSRCWDMILNFLRRIQVKESEVDNFLRESCKNIQQGLLKNIESFARVFAIFGDLNLLQKGNKTDLLELLYSIHSINSRLYVNFELADRVLELIYHLLNFQVPCEFISPFLVNALDFLLIAAKRSNLNYDNVEKYSAIFKLVSERKVQSGNEFLGFFHNEAIYCLENANICPGLRRLYGIKILMICQELRNGILGQEMISLLLNNYSIPLTFEEEESLSGIKGKATTEYYSTIGKIIHVYLEKDGEIPENCLVTASALLDKAGTNGISFVIGILSKISIRGSKTDLEEVKILVKTCWKSIVAGKRNRFFWNALDNILPFIFNPNCFGFEDNFVHEILNEILKEGEAAPSLKIRFLENLNNLETKWFIYFKEAILNCLLHGQVPRRDTKIELQTLEFLSTRNCELKNHNLDAEVRARAVILFHKAISSDEQFSSAFFLLVIKSLGKFKGKRYFADSNSHRIQQRIFQALLIFEPILNPDCSRKLRDEIIDIVLSNAADQPSVQIMMSWILSRIYSRQESGRSDLWDFFKKVKEKRPGNLKFVACVILQISKLVDKDDGNLHNFLTTAISHLAPECLGPTFNTRLVCQMVLVKLYERMERDNLYKATIETLNQRNFPIANEFYFQDFHLLNNYSLQSAYYDVPRLTNMSGDELILPRTFEIFGFFQTKVHPLRLVDELNSLSQINLLSAKKKSTEKSNDCHTDLQKKIVPDKSSIFEDEENSDNETIIVVASLVERLPNLGGIARTCEIFGAGQLVLGNKKCTENKEFQSLSVTAEKWIKVTEVKPQELSKYLMEMKDNGWKLVGLEQTAHSCSLLETKFEKKTVLLLGNEKDGIPPNLIPILDTCVEIPQVGIIRSLNVHVTGAICIWEYAKQHLFS